MLAIVTPADLDEVLGGLSAVGGRCHGHRHRHRERPAAHPRRLRRRRGPGRHAGRVAAGGRPAYERPIRRPADLDDLWARDTASLRADDAGADLLDLARATRRGCIGSTTTSSSSTPSRVPAATPPCCGSSTRITGVDTGRGLAVTTDGNHRWCAVDPRAGTAMVVAESVLNLACVGRPTLGAGQLPQLRQPRAPRGHVAAVRGDRRHGRGLPGVRHAGDRRQREPLQREPRHATSTRPPWSAVLGVVDALRRRPPGVGLVDGGRLLLLGRPAAELGGGSLWALRRHGVKGGTLPPLDLVAHVDLLGLVADLVTDDELQGIHDVSEGGLAVALGEMAVRAGVGFSVFGVAGAGGLFSEAPSRVVVCVAPRARLGGHGAGGTRRSARDRTGRSRRRPTRGSGPSGRGAGRRRGRVPCDAIPDALRTRRPLIGDQAGRRSLSSSSALSATSRSPRPVPTERSGL